MFAQTAIMEDSAVEMDLEKVYEVLQKLIGIHRQLLELVRAERHSLEELDLKALQEIVYNKEVAIHACKHAELERVRSMAALGINWKTPMADFSLLRLIEIIQGRDLKSAEKFRSVYNTLKVMVDRISEQNKDNRKLVEKSLEHVSSMKRNVLGEATAKSETYTPKGVRSDVGAGSRLISKEV